jgi:uncharacterized OsmC-like protein
MTSTDITGQTDAAAGTQPGDLWVRRTGTRTYTGHNGRGAEVLIGPIENDGSFTPGELLKIALAACTGLTTDAVLARRLGDDFDATITVEGAKDVDADRYPAITENLLVDVAGLSPADLKRLLTIVHRSVDEHCTVGRTVTTGTRVSLQVNGDVAH